MISVIIVSYKRHNDVIDCIKSIKKNVKNSTQIIVVCNDGKHFNKIAGVNFIYPDSNLGVAGGRNLGAKYAKNKWLMFIDDDAVVERFSVNTLSVSRKLGALSVKSIDFYSGEFRKHENPSINGMYSSKYVGVCHLIRKNLFLSLGGYDVVSNYGMEEYNFLYKMYSTGKNVGNADITVRHKKSKDGRGMNNEKVETLAIAKLSLIRHVVPTEIYLSHLFFWGIRLILRGSLSTLIKILKPSTKRKKTNFITNRANFYLCALKGRTNVFY